MQEQISFFTVFTSKLSELGLDYMVTGSAAGIVFGEPRLTHDIDIVLRLPKGKVVEFIQAFSEEDFYCPPEEIILQEIGRPSRGHINLIHNRTGFKADIYFIGIEPLQKWGLENRKRVEVDSSQIFFAPIAYVILYKLKYFKEGGSEKHKRDILGLLRVSRDNLNLTELKEMASELDLAKQLNLILSDSAQS